MVRTVVVALCLVGVVADATAAAGHRARSDAAVAVPRLRSWSSSMASTHLPGPASVLAARRQPVVAGTIVVVEDVIQLATCKRRYRALEVCIGLPESRTLFEDGARVELKVHKLGSLLVVGRIGVVMSFDPREFGIVVAVSR
jgi:hypothetical protein